jgi:selenide,water dikinase
LTTPALPEQVLVALESGDDAAVYALPDGRALVQTVDFFTPVVDDPYDWGRIAAANAFSDVYAMGGRPILALNLVGWPVDELPLEVLGRVLEGGAVVAAQAGAVIVGGHTLSDPQPKYGMAVTGFADRDRILRNSTAPPGARLFLTKPLGIGIITTAIKREAATARQVRLAVEEMTTLNEAAAHAAVAAGVEAATDVTGYGLLGHLHAMLAASGVAARLDAAAVELLPGTLRLAQEGVIPGGTRRTHAFLRPFVDFGELTEPEQLVLADAQTSGGLLLATRDGDELTRALDGQGTRWFEIGVTVPGPSGQVTLGGRLREADPASSLAAGWRS